MPLAATGPESEIGDMTVIALTFVSLYLVVLFRVLSDDRPRSALDRVVARGR